MTKDPFLQFFLECGNPTMSSTLQKLDRFFRNPKNPNNISVSKSRPTELQKSSPKNLVHQIAVWKTVGFSMEIPSRNLPRTSVAPAVAAGVSTFDLSQPGPLLVEDFGAKMKKMSNLEALFRLVQTIFFGMLYRCLQ